MDKTTQERILEDANRLYRGRPDSHHPSNYKYIDGYIAGATAEAANTQRAIELMQEIIKLSDRNQVAWNQAKDFIQQWKGEKDGVQDGKVCTCDNIHIAAHGECWACPGRHTKKKGGGDGS